MTDTTTHTPGPWAVTMADIYAHGPCAEGWVKLREHTGLPATDNTTLVTLLTILGSNGLDDALWCLRAVKGRDREIRLFAVWCARQVQHLMADPRSIAALDVAERYADGDATPDELSTAGDAARAAAGEAAGDAAWAAAWAAAGDAAGAAARVAAWAAAEAAARDAAWAAAGAAAWVAAGDAARDAAWDAQESKFKEMVG
ncbi:MAG: hypothetical protein ACOYBR_10330 [Fluviibacter sp.]